MNESIGTPGKIVDVGPLGRLLETSRHTTLIKTTSVEIVQLVIPAGGQVPLHEAQGELILHCLEGRVTLAVAGASHELRAGQLLYLLASEPFSVDGVEDSSLLATILPREGARSKLIGGSTRAR